MQYEIIQTNANEFNKDMRYLIAVQLTRPALRNTQS